MKKWNIRRLSAPASSSMAASSTASAADASAAITTALTAWLLGKGAGDHTEVIVAGVAAALTFAYEQIASYLTSKATMKIPPRVGGQSLAQPAIPFTSDSGRTFTRSEMFNAIIAKPTSPSEDNAALLELRESLLKPSPTMPTTPYCAVPAAVA